MEQIAEEKTKLYIKAKAGEINIPKEDPFENDKLDRKKSAKVLTSAVSAFQDGAVIALNGAWGTGKTTFVKMWAQHLDSNGFPVIYYNAWEDDISDEPLISLLRNLNGISKKQDGGKLEEVFKAGGRILAGIAIGAAKAAFGKAGEIIAGAAEGGLDAIQEQFTDSLKEKDEITQTMKKFKKALEEYVAFVCDQGKPLVYFIDELDRCNPSFAVKVLERIKHLFDVPNVVFVLSIDKQQLAYSINGFYGSEKIDSMEYLRRFIDIDYNLQEPDPEKYCDYLYDYYSFADFIESNSRKQVVGGRVFDDKEGFISMAKLIVKYKHLNLRQTERIFVLARIALCEMSSTSKLFPDVLFLLTYLKVCEQVIFESINALSYRLQELLDVLEAIATDDLIKEDEKGYNRYPSVVCHLIICYSESIRVKYKQPDLRYETIFDENSSDHHSNLVFNKFDQDLVFSILKYYNERRHFSACPIGHFTDKIALLEPFKIE